MICLDNDVFSRYASQQSYPAVSEYLAAHSSEAWLLPSIVFFEYLQRYSAYDTIPRIARTGFLAQEATDEGVNSALEHV